ncbi:helix-turn-helix transcriptional regulator [Amorphoplanes nipponensis]|uniref:Transcriptional regulator n=1 Tax=Actinoplanes nipponensis TaxID=135950 RepID=A0A919MF79_9ACTN|nr:helix-turn-helix transcriptional regulator [Actinoplanes nipponensis]GIE47239.1 transcriptional regulator [Actinoplanes nipponensis]
MSGDRTGPEPGAAEAVGRRIQQLRTARGLTQRELAAPRYTGAYVSSVEAGRRMPSTDALAHFAERLGTSRQELLTGRAPAHDLRIDLELALAEAAAGPDPAAAEAAYRRLSAETGRAGDTLHAAQCHLGLGRLALERGEPERAVREFDEAARLSAGAPAHLRVGPVIGHAECRRHQGDPRYGAYLLRQALTELTEAGLPDPDALLGLHAHLALCHHDLDDDAEAADAAAAALALAGPRDAATVADLHLKVCRTLLARGDTRAAEVALLQARQARRQAALAVPLAGCRVIRGRARRTSGDLAAALRDLADAHASFVAAGRAGLVIDSAVELAEVYRALGRRAEARQLLADLAPGGPAGARVPAADRVLAALATDDGDLPAAERHLRDAADGYRRTGPRRHLAAVVLSLADNLEAQGRAAEAVALLQQGLADVERLSGEPSRPAVAAD